MHKEITIDGKEHFLVEKEARDQEWLQNEVVSGDVVNDIETGYSYKAIVFPINGDIHLLLVNVTNWTVWSDPFPAGATWLEVIGENFIDVFELSEK